MNPDNQSEIKQTELLINLSFLFAQPTGITTYALNLVPYLKSLDPTLLLADRLDLASINYYKKEFKFYPIPDNLTPAQGTKGHLNRLIWTQFQLPKIYQKLKASLLFSPVPEMPLYRPCSSVIMVHDLIPLRFPRLSPLSIYFSSYLPLVLQQAKHIICNSQATATDLVKFLKIPEAKITPILLGYDQQHFHPLKLTNNNHQKPYFLYIGRYDPYKNLHRLVKAFADLNNPYDCELWLVGSLDPRYTPLLKKQVQELNLENQVKFLDYVSYDQLPIIINQAIALVFPSLWEGFGLPVIEAMACGTPVITSNFSSLQEIAQDAALLVDPYQTQEITAAMSNIINDNQLRLKLRQLGLKRASQFSWAKTGQQTVEVLQKFV